MSVTRTLEPAVKLLFAIVKQNPIKDAKNSEQMLVEAKALIQTIRRLEDFKKLEYEGLSKTLNKEIKFENDVSLDARDENGATFLTWASDKGHTPIVGLLLEHKANPDLANEKTGATPLVSAAFGDHTDIVSMLLKAGAKVDVPTKDGKTALDYAIERQNLDMIILLLKHNAVIKSPEVLFNFLLTCDPRNPDVLFALNKLKEQQSRMRELKVADAKMSGLRDDKYKELETYHTQLSKVSERLHVSRELLDKSVGNTLPNPLLDIIRKLDAPLYRLNNSDTLFRNKKQADEFREELAKKYKEFFPSRSRWNPFG